MPLFTDRIVRTVEDWQQSTHVQYDEPFEASLATEGYRGNNDRANI
jgi:hypothetical protein